jgi:hypothetical protein
MVRKSAKILSLAIVTIMTMSSLIVFPLGETSATATVPTWQVGDSWAMSGNRNMTDLYDQFGDEAVWFYSGMGMMSSSSSLSDQPDTYSHNKTINYANVWGQSNAYSLSEVKGETSSTYDLKVTMAVNFSVGATFDYNSEMLAPGSYRSHRSNQPWGSFLSDSNGSIQNVTLNNVVVNNVIYNGQVRGAMLLVADMNVSKTDLSISSMSTSVQGYVNGEFELKNYPRSQWSYENNNIDYGTVSMFDRTFNNYDVSFTSNVSSDLALAFAPSLDLYHFPMNAGDKWNVSSKATINGNLGGNLNVVGLPADLKDKLFANNPGGLTGFPIELASIYDPHLGALQNGKVSVERNISLSIQATGPRTIYDPTLGTIKVMDLQYNGVGTAGSVLSSEKLTILADKGRIVGLGSLGMRPTNVHKATDAIKLLTQETAAKPLISKRPYTSRYVTGITATLPTWNVGEKWTLAGTKDIASMFDALGEDKNAIISALTTSVYSINGVVRNKTMDSGDIWGRISSSAVIEVVGQTATDYQLRVRMGTDVVGGLYYSFNADIVNPGTYRTSRYGGAPWGFLSSDAYANVSSALTTNKDVTYQGSIDGASYLDANISVSRSNLSIGSIVMTSSSYLKADMVGKNVVRSNSSVDQKGGYDYGQGYGLVYYLPDSYHYGSANLITVNNGDYNYTVDYKDNLNLTMLFSDYLQVMKFPMNVGDTWSKPTHIDVEGNISGHLDVTGLSAEANSSYMKILEQTNVNGLPVDFAHLYNPTNNNTPFKNGTFSYQTVINPSFRCARAYIVDDAVAGKVAAFQIVPTNSMSPMDSFYLQSLFSLDYLPDSGRVASINVDYVVDLGLKTTDAAQAEASLSRISTEVSQGFGVMDSIALSDGSILQLHQNRVMMITVDGVQQTIELISSNATASVFRLGGAGGQEFTLSIGESRELDLNGDGKNDVSFLLTSVSGGSAEYSVENLASSSGAGSGTGSNDLTLIVAAVGVVAVVLAVGAVLLIRKKRRA